jgi:glycosyltransferase involved in cell wall biosynthesis
VKHIAVMIPGLDRIGGAERQAMLLAIGLRRRGCRVTMVALSGSGGTAAEELVAAGVGFVSLEMRKGLADPRGWLRFHCWLKCEQPHVVHAHLPHAAWMARWSRLAAHVSVVIDTVHSSATGTLGRRIGYALSRWLPDHVTAVSHAGAASHLTAGMVSQERFSVLANGIDVENWHQDRQVRNEMRAELGLQGEFLWLAVGRLEPVKGLPALLIAMAQLSRPARLFVLGDGPLRSELVRLAERLGLERLVRFRGFEPDVKPWMQAADGLVLSSRYEGLPTVLLEAGACSLPVVATDVPGTHEVLVDGETGCLARAGDVGSLGAQMARLMEMTPKARRVMGEKARKRVIDNFSLEVVLDRWEELYEELLERNVRRRVRLRQRTILTRLNAPKA